MSARRELNGRCQCGAVGYTVTADPLAFYACHCTNCRRQGGSAFALSLLIPIDGWRINTGEPGRFSFEGDSGRAKTGLFCRDCGVRLSHESAGADTRTIRAGTMDDVAAWRPAGHIWTASALPWIRFHADDLVYERMPDDGFSALAERWASTPELRGG